MNSDLVTIVKQIVTEQGESVLSQPKRVSAFFSDLAQEVPKPHKNAFIKCLEHGFAQLMKNAAETERTKCKEDLAQRLHEAEGLDLRFCEESLNLLTAVLFGEEIVTTIAEGAFEDKQPGSVIIPNGVTTIERFAFYDKQLTSVTIPCSVTTIGKAAFSNNLLTSIIIPNGVTTIEEYTFFENHLESVIIPKSVTTIDRSAFCRNILTSVSIGANVELGGSRKIDAFDRGFDNFYKSNGRKAGTYIYGIGGWKVQ